MTDERIKEEFERWNVNPYSAEEINFAFTSCEKNERKASFYAGFRAAERFAKIEVLEDIERAIMAMEYPNNNPEELRIRDVIGYVEQQIKLLKAGQ